MNQKLTYEHTIAAKLEVLPVPDLEAAIWKRIEFQLDIDMPGDGGVEVIQPPRFPKPGPLMLSAVSIIFITALLVFFILKKKDHTTSTKISNPATTPIISSKQKDPGSPPSERKGQQPLPIVNTGATPYTLQEDSNTYALPPAFAPDSNTLIKDRGDVIIIPPAASGKDTEHSIKKKKGVQGLTDEDYRVEPKKKDSLP